MKMKFGVAAGLLALGLLGGAFWLRVESGVPQGIILYGNADQRQVELAFIDAERIVEVLAEEGDVVKPGQVLARLETRRLRDRMAAVEAQVMVSEAALERLKNGTRPEEIDQARAAVDQAEAEAAYAAQQYKRYSDIWQKSGGTAVSLQNVDETRSRHNVAQAGLLHARKALALAEAGPRQEDIAEAEAVLLNSRRALTELRNNLMDAELKSPAASVVRRRLMEPGDMASPQRPVFSLAVITPKWIRAYLAETELGLVRPGMPAKVYTDSRPDQAIDGTVGFISPVAEFTPKTVQTTELRTSLVYEIRVYVEDPQDIIRLGMPATVVFPGLARPAAPGLAARVKDWFSVE